METCQLSLAKIQNLQREVSEMLQLLQGAKQRTKEGKLDIERKTMFSSID
jgi:hypothetical protein